MKKLLGILILLSFGFLLSAQKVDEKWLKENYYKREYKIKMRDGVSLFTAA